MNKKLSTFLNLTFAFVFFVVTPSWGLGALDINQRWTIEDRLAPELSTVIEALNIRTHLNFTANDFVLAEDKPLATSHFKHYQQMWNGFKVAKSSIRLWIDEQNQSLILAEANVEAPQLLAKNFRQASNLRPQSLIFSQNEKLATNLNSNLLITLIRPYLKKNKDDPYFYAFTYEDFWEAGILVRLVKVKGKRGTHQLKVSLGEQKVISYDYQSFPQLGHALGENAADEFSLKAQVFPLFEEIEDAPYSPVMPRKEVQLKYLKKVIKKNDGQVFEPLSKKIFYQNLLDPEKAKTEIGRAQGYWSFESITAEYNNLLFQLPFIPNVLDSDSLNNSVVLEGKFATINLHPDVWQVFKGVEFAPSPSIHLKEMWQAQQKEGREVFYMQLASAFWGKPITHAMELYLRPAPRLKDHNPLTYINQGFDEVQVYYSINQLMEILSSMGFSDPDISTRPFHAFLYDPDISMKDNAYYSDDTINFTTYSPGAINYARDNPTIWHELGHGIMDRIMGERLVLADTGGLSEGMADFIAFLVINSVTQGKNYEGREYLRIINNTGFFLTNEVHDDGEAYGGVLADILASALQLYGIEGLHMVTDLTLEAMRLSRNHPKLGATEWFTNLLYADELGRSGLRRPSQLKNIIVQAIKGRNFDMQAGARPAQFRLVYDGQPVDSDEEGSREHPVAVSMLADEEKSFDLQVSFTEGDSYPFKYPLTVRVQFEKGPLQGAINWEGQSQGLELVVPHKGAQLQVPLTIKGKCQTINREDGSCVDFAYFKVFSNASLQKPIAKKRFYIRLTTVGEI